MADETGAPATETAAPVVSETTLATATPPDATQTPNPQEPAADPNETPEAKAEREKLAQQANETPEQKAEREKLEAAKKVPEKYEFKTPDNLVVDPEAQTEFEAVAKELGLSQENAQRIYELGAKAVAKNNTAMAESIASTQASWLEASKADKEFGGEKLNENMAIAKKALELNPAMIPLLNESKLGNHPEVIRWMYKVGQKLSEDKFVQAPKGALSAEDQAKRLYPNQN